MLNFIDKVLCYFESCFSRKAAFHWFVTFTSGLMLRSDKPGVTSVIRDLALRPECYLSMIHFFREGGFWITFPDSPECMTQGDDMQHAYEMAVDALGLAITSREADKEELPTPSEPYNIAVNENEFCAVVAFDMLAYKKRTNSKAVKKTLSIPEWLNEEATALDINFSQVLQEALMQKVGAR